MALGLLYNFNNLLSNEITYFLYIFINKLNNRFLGVLSSLNLNLKFLQYYLYYNFDLLI